MADNSVEILESEKGRDLCRGEEQTHPNIYVRDTVLSLKCSCPLSQRGCEWLGTLGECENHLDVCSYVHKKCKLGCEIVLPRHELKIHVSEQCNFREIPCEHCQTDFKAGDMPVHIEKCPKMPLKCELKCGTVMCRMDMAHHLEKDCGRVVVECKLDCGRKLPRDELSMHVNTKCVQRMIPCEYCHIDLKACEMTIHLVECPKMPLKCELGCGTVVCRNNMAQHIEEECVEKMIECPFIKYKCEVGLIKRKELNQHLEEKRTEHTELKLSAMEEILMKQSENPTHNEIIRKQGEMIEQMSQEMESLKTEAKLNKEILKQILPKITNLYWKIKMEDIRTSIIAITLFPYIYKNSSKLTDISLHLS
ncbi:TRAF-like protein [Oopsacas minuta]|uniref:TRAF-like protein n=1 Tax=Oopsacas minuta TaxID=111878 RepID=A0AAV7JF27_9METZ|nr:TRAF-like protein [Oopsacas minuta]